MAHAYIHSKFTVTFQFNSVFNLQNRTKQCFCMNYIDRACIGANLKILQDSSNFCKSQCVLYFLNSGGSRISNMTFPCVMKITKISLHIFISLHFSAFQCISLRFSAFNISGQLYGAYRRPVDAIFEEARPDRNCDDLFLQRLCPECGRLCRFGFYRHLAVASRRQDPPQGFAATARNIINTGIFLTNNASTTMEQICQK